MEPCRQLQKRSSSESDLSIWRHLRRVGSAGSALCRLSLFATAVIFGVDEAILLAPFENEML
jgi:hypothetical protein